jgi:hypothetical protein
LLTETNQEIASMTSQTIEDMISVLLVEEKRTIPGDTEHETALTPKYNCSISAKDKGEMECRYCRKMGHTSWNCRSQASDILKRKF